MELEKKKQYIQQYVAEGMTLENCYSLLYMDEAAVVEVEQDVDFIAEMRDMLAQLTLTNLTSYNSKVRNSFSPGDHLKRLSLMAPNIFKESSPVEMTGELVIVKKRMDD